MTREQFPDAHIDCVGKARCCRCRKSSQDPDALQLRCHAIVGLPSFIVADALARGCGYFDSMDKHDGPPQTRPRHTKHQPPTNDYRRHHRQHHKA